MVVTNITTEAGNIIVTFENSGIPQRFAIADILRAADIPALTYEQVAAVVTLAGLTVILIRTLIERGILDESFGDSLGLDWDLDHLIYAVEQIGGSYSDPNIYVPN